MVLLLTFSLLHVAAFVERGVSLFFSLLFFLSSFSEFGSGVRCGVACIHYDYMLYYYAFGVLWHFE